jgi:hypothetical protein
MRKRDKANPCWRSAISTTTAWSFHQPQIDPLVEQRANDQVGVSLYHIVCHRGVLGFEPDENFRNFGDRPLIWPPAFSRI